MDNLSDVFEIEVDRDGLCVLLKQHLALPNGLKAEDLLLFLKEHGIVYGIKTECINNIVSCEMPLPAVVAEGKSRRDGKDAFIASILEGIQQQNELAKLDDEEDKDLRKVIDIPSVAAGTVVGRKVEAVAEENGISVYGEEIRAKRGRDIKLRPGKNTRISDDGTEIIATIDGQVSIEPKVIHVFPVYEVNGDLDLKVGNIDFIGNVNIRGNVPSGFEIRAKGDIRVRGSVEAAILIAGGSIYIHQGVVAQGNGQIIAEGEVKTSFLNQAIIRAKGDIHVTKSILHSTLETQGYLFCKQGKGNIVGGKISSGKGIEVNEIGNQMNTPTILYLGLSESIVEEEKKRKLQLKQAQEDVQKLGLLLKRIIYKEKQQPLSPQEKIMKLRIRNSLIESNRLMEESNEKLADLQDFFMEQDMSKVKIYHSVYPNTVLTFGKYKRKIVKKHENVLFRIERGEIKFESLR